MTNFTYFPPDGQEQTPVNLTHTLTLVTPEQAKEWLSNKLENQRRVSPTRVKNYQKQMIEGTWEPWSTLMFTTNDQLIDGQHRLEAVVKADRPVHFIVAKGFPPDAILTVDQGKSRNALDVAKIKLGRDLGTRLASCLSACFLSTDTGATPPTLPTLRSAELIVKHYDALHFASSRGHEKQSVGYSPFIAPVARAYYTENHKRLGEFLKVLHTGFTVSADPKEDHAAIALRNYYFARIKGIKQTSESTTRAANYRRATTALYYFLNRKPLKVLKETSQNHFPVADFDEWWK